MKIVHIVLLFPGPFKGIGLGFGSEVGSDKTYKTEM